MSVSGQNVSLITFVKKHGLHIQGGNHCQGSSQDSAKILRSYNLIAQFSTTGIWLSSLLDLRFSVALGKGFIGVMYLE